MHRPAAMSAAGIRTSLTFAAVFAALGAHLPFWPLWLSQWGLTSAEIGSYTAAGMVVRVLAGFGVPAIADRLDQRRQVFAVIALFGTLAFALHAMIETRTILLLATLCTGIVFAGMIPIADALGTAAGRVNGFPYAHARAMGSLAFLLTSLICGKLISLYGVQVALIWIVVCLALTALLAVTHPGGGKVRATVRPGFGELLSILKNPTFLLFLAAIGLAHSSHAVLYAYASIHWLSLGVSETVIGFLWAFAVGVEVLMMLTIGPVLVERLGPITCVALAAGTGVVRWIVMMQDPTGVLLWAMQALHSVTFAVGHLAGIAFIAAAIPDRLAASAQGMFSSAAGGILTAGAMMIAAGLYPVYGGGTYAIAAVMSAVGLALALILRRKWSGGPVME